MTKSDALRDRTQHPISRIEWLSVDMLDRNDYNPNHVLSPEMRLLKSSLLKQGWIQPILVSRENRDGETRYVIIDGFHRSTLAKTDKDVRAMTDGLVPCAVLDLPLSERKMLTVRINRAKGSHAAVKMHELVQSLATEDGLSVAQIAEGIGATSHEVNTLLQENLFEKFDVANHEYSKAWMPR